jgi:hypothetical protein
MSLSKVCCGFQQYYQISAIMKKIIFLFPLATFSFSILAQKPAFNCPVRNGRIIIEESGTEVKKNPGAVFEGKDLKVYNISEGQVKSIDTSYGLITVFVESDEYSFSYHNLESVIPKLGQSITINKLIGKIKKGEKLFLIMSNNKELVDPEKFLPCKIIHRFVRGY